jgi:serine/threonine protein kinase
MAFTIIEKISESSITSVYCAFDAVLQRRILLKVLHKHHAADHDLYERFVREAQACAALRSEYIVQIYELIEYEGSPAIVLEFIDGTSLKNQIDTGTTRSLIYARKVALHTLRGLVAAHERGIIHRDIKPGNILVATDGTMKVTDFGLAYLASVPTITTQGMVMGTPAYMSPEQIRHEAVDQRTDLFSLGVTLVEVLTGSRLFEGTSYAECAKKILTFKVDMLNYLVEKSSAEFVEFLKLLLAPKKKNRYATSREALSAVDNDRSTIFISAPVTAPMRNRQIVVLSGGAVLLGVLVFFLSTVNHSSKSRNSGPNQLAILSDTTSARITATGETQRKPTISSPVQAEPILQPRVLKQPEVSMTTTIPLSMDSGAVLLTSTPWAKVYVDNVFIGETPISKPYTLSAGKHSVMFMHPSFEPILQSIIVLPNRELQVAGNFIENAGFLSCIATPWAEVYVDGQYKDTTPLDKPIVLSPGKHRVRFKNASFNDVHREVTIKSKDTISLCIFFEKQR